jgi:hypothetical protein
MKVSKVAALDLQTPWLAVVGALCTAVIENEVGA